MADLQRMEIKSEGVASEEEAAQALAAAAAAAPTTEEEARAKLAAKADKPKDGDAAEGTHEVPERPANVPEKFWDAEKGQVNTEALLRSYSELEKSKTKGTGDEAAEETGTEDDTADKAGDDAEKAPVKAAEVVSTLNERFQSNGELTDEDYALAESIGHDRATVDQFIEGQKALAEAAERRITEAAGGKESLDRMFAWAKTGLSGTEIDTFNKSFAGSDVNAAVIAMEQLKGRYEAANGRDPKLINGKPAGASSDVYASWAQVTADMGKPEYRKDPAFRQKVQAKLERSHI